MKRLLFAAAMGLLAALSLIQSAHALKSKDVHHYRGFKVKVDGIDIWVETHGDPRNPAILFFPGGPGSSHTYYHVPASSWNKLARSENGGQAYFQIFFDPPGTGKSQKPESGEYSYEANSRAAKAVWDAVKERFAKRGLNTKQKLNIVGQSAGGGMVLDFATRYPEIVRALIAVDGVDTNKRQVQGAQDFENSIIKAMFPREWAAAEKLYREENMRDSKGRLIEGPKYKAAYGKLWGKGHLNTLHPEDDAKSVDEENPDIWYAFYGPNADRVTRTRWDLRKQLHKLAEHGIRVRYIMGSADHNEPPDVLMEGVKNVGYGDIRTFDSGHMIMLKGEAGEKSLRAIQAHFRPGSRTGAPKKGISRGKL